MKNGGPFLRDQIVNSPALGGIATGTDITGRFIDRDVELAPGLNGTPIHQNTIVPRIDLRPELGNGLPVNGNRALKNEFFTRPARGYPRVREELQQTHRHIFTIDRPGCRWK